ncbi:MAG: AAA family ATPase [Clostridia bacterium]|nr:AAA family ATPase [Clostridia bacterium]
MPEAGKTTIALHRIAYLIYNYEKQFKPEEFMIIAPTRFFLNYISNILPDLGVDNVKQCTFEDFAYDVIGKKLKISDSNEKLVIIVNKSFDEINKGNTEIMIQEAKFKSSLNFKRILDEYLIDVENNYIPKEDFCFMGHTIMKHNDIDYLFKHTYKIYNYTMRINELEKNMISELNKKSPQIIEEIKSERTAKISGLTGKARVDLYEEYDKTIKLLEKGQKKIVKEYLNKIPKLDCVKYYKDFIDNYLQNSTPVMEYLKQNTGRNLSKNEISFEDLAPLMYIQIKIFGIKEKCKVKHVVIDEAQDYGEFQFDVLKNIINSNSMTILGDIAQGVHYYRGIENWKSFIEAEFKDVKTTYTTLSKTYRTTKEIMEVANKVIDKLPEYEKEFIVLGDPVIDRKNSIYMHECCRKEQAVVSEINNRINKHIEDGYKSIAIIAKDMKECEQLEKMLSKMRSDVKLIEGKDSEYNAGISIVPSYLAKGLEFDCVIISNANNKKYTNSSLDIKLLYVTITRAMSKLDVFYEDELTNLMK